MSDSGPEYEVPGARSELLGKVRFCPQSERMPVADAPFDVGDITDT
jgi:hypothetical protein